MKTVIVQVEVKLGFVQAFLIETERSRKATRDESGCMGYDIFQNADNECKFVLVETYVSDAAIEIHKQTPHFLEWREKVQELMEVPRIGARHNCIYSA